MKVIVVLELEVPKALQDLHLSRDDLIDAVIHENMDLYARQKIKSVYTSHESSYPVE